MMIQALEELAILQAIDEDTGKITNLGRDLVKFPVEPMEARCILKGIELGVSDEICVILAMMSVNEAGLFETSGNNNNNNTTGRANADANRSNFAKTLGDHLTFLAIYEGYANAAISSKHGNANAVNQWCQTNGINAKQMKKAVDIEVQLRNHCEKIRSELSNIATSQNSNINNNNVNNFVGPYRPTQTLRSEAANEYPNIRRSFVAGFFMHSSYYDLKSRMYKTAVGQDVVYVHPKSVISDLKKKPALVLFHTVVNTQKAYMREVLAIRDDWLFDEAPNVFPRPTSSG
jgi:ATP-dependent RNA helicase DHX8/PRP22